MRVGVSGGVAEGGVEDGGGGVDALLRSAIRSLSCWDHFQNKAPDGVNKIHDFHEKDHADHDQDRRDQIQSPQQKIRIPDRIRDRRFKHIIDILWSW